jgi:ketosteroid isomerase-like protein
LDEVRQLDGDRVLALFHFSGRGKTSGVDLAELQSQAAAVFHIRQGKLTRIVRYWDGERALADLGLAPEDDSQR